ncbi:MAG: LON peptidase substrate-binding domain-containing protein [Bacteroidetes bacterium]|nr:LON peptidase substrate-binding domain-containing protein [Bacteroidota bacterium]MBS1740681.1 LON peptidase substrate-binding domain-containing protein [Bacteroidota bacterium]
MINFIPIFPLDIVVYPRETLNLHIFEPRYKQMISECLRNNKPFGILPVLDHKMEQYGISIEIVEMVKEYDQGEMDIRTVGKSVFRVLEQVHQIPEKLYQGAIVEYPSNEMTHGDTQIAQLIVSEVKRLFALLDSEEKLPISKLEMMSYDVAHFIGLNLQQEYELLCLMEEVQRLEYIRRHLNKLIPAVKELEEVKARIRRNGHFRDLSLKDFNL